MHLFLIRHGETEHNVAGFLAGVTDSNLTNHGVLQTQRLARHLIGACQIRFTHIFASDLKRAFMTADEIRKSQNEVVSSLHKVAVTKLELLREQDFGSLELTKWSSRHDDDASTTHVTHPSHPDHKPKETKEAMRLRADQFLDDFIAPLFVIDEELKLRIAIVSHGLFLGSLWKALLSRYNGTKLTIGPDVGLVPLDRPLEYLPGWSNTGYLELKIASIQSKTTAEVSEKVTKEEAAKPEEGIAPKTSITLLAVNSKEHLLNFKRQRGGLGSVVHDERQTKLEGFFRKQKKQKTSSKQP